MAAKFLTTDEEKRHLIEECDTFIFDLDGKNNLTKILNILQQDIDYRDNQNNHVTVSDSPDIIINISLFW